MARRRRYLVFSDSCSIPVPEPPPDLSPADKARWRREMRLRAEVLNLIGGITHTYEGDPSDGFTSSMAEITAHMVNDYLCPECGAIPGEPCTGVAPAVHGERN